MLGGRRSSDKQFRTLASRTRAARALPILRNDTIQNSARTPWRKHNFSKATAMRCARVLILGTAGAWSPPDSLIVATPGVRRREQSRPSSSGPDSPCTVGNGVHGDLHARSVRSRRPPSTSERGQQSRLSLGGRRRNQARSPTTLLRGAGGPAPAELLALAGSRDRALQAHPRGRSATSRCAIPSNLVEMARAAPGTSRRFFLRGHTRRVVIGHTDRHRLELHLSVHRHAGSVRERQDPTYPRLLTRTMDRRDRHVRFARRST